MIKEVVLLIGVLQLVNCVDVVEPDRLAMLKEINDGFKDLCTVGCGFYRTWTDANTDEDKAVKADYAACSLGCNKYLLPGHSENCESTCLDLHYKTGEKGFDPCHNGCQYAQGNLKPAKQPQKPAIQIDLAPSVAEPQKPIVEIGPAVIDTKPGAEFGTLVDQKPQPGAELGPQVDPKPQSADLPVQPIQIVDPLDFALNNGREEFGDSQEEGASSSEEKEDDEDEGASSSSEEDKSGKYNFGKFFSSDLLFGGAPDLVVYKPDGSVEHKNQMDDGGLSQMPGLLDRLFNTNLHEMTEQLIASTEDIMKNLPIGNSGGFMITSEMDEDGQVKTHIQSLDGEQNENKIGDDKPINWKGVPLSIGSPIEELLDSQRLDAIDAEMRGQHMNHHRYRVCYPMQLTYANFCRDINNLFNCTSMYSGIPRWVLVLLVLLTSFFMLWMGVFLLSMVQRMRREQRLRPNHDDYLPLYKDIDFSIETRIEAGPLPEKQPLQTV